MTFRQHLLIDGLGQAVLLIFYSLLIGKSESPHSLIPILPIVLGSWQFINALLAYKFFERETKRTFVRVCGWSLVGICAAWGALWFMIQIPGMQSISANIASGILPSFWLFLPIFAALMSVWYIYITIKDIYNMMFNTI